MTTEFGIILNTKKEQNFIKINVENIFFAENKVIKTGEYKNFEYTKLPKRYVYYENYNIPCYIYKDGNKIIINKKFDYNLGIDANIDTLAKTCIVFLKCYLVLDNEYNYSLSLSKTITLSNDEEHQAYEYYEDWILSQFKEYELLNNKYDGVTGSDGYSYFKKAEKYDETEKGELIKNALVYLNMKYGYSIKEDIFKQFEEIDFDEDKKK